VKKVGQPDSAVEMTAGRRSLLNSLVAGRADRGEQAMAANWLRDLYAHHGLPSRLLSDSDVYRSLYAGTTSLPQDQDLTHEWIMNLVNSIFTKHEREYIMTEDELIRKGQRETLPGGANAMQVGGSHYNSKPIQHWDFVSSNDYGYLEGQITKYLSRWQDKNGLQDVQKSAHFLQKLIEVSAGEVDNPISLQDFMDANKLHDDERSVFVAIHAYHHTLDNVFLAYANDAMKRVLARAAATAPKTP
jgi:hypothetical protein